MEQNPSTDPQAQSYQHPHLPPLPPRLDTPVPPPPLSHAQAHAWVLNRYLEEITAPYIGGVPVRTIILENMVRFCLKKDMAMPPLNNFGLSSKEEFAALLHDGRSKLEFRKFAESMIEQWLHFSL
jgi:hypothetical protein